MQSEDTTLKRENDFLRQLLKLNLELDFDKLLEFTLDSLLTLSGGKGGFLAVVEDGTPIVKSARRFPREGLVQASLTLSGRVPALVPASDLLAGAPPSERLYYVPIATESTVQAAAYLQPGASLPQGEDLAALLEFCGQAAVSVENFHLYKAAMYDKATGLYSLTNVLSRLEEELSRTARYKRKLTVLLVEIDRYSLLADIHGPSVAARLLRSVVEIARRSVRKADVAGRYSEQVIALILPETPLPQAQLITKRI
ncbi:MAG: diguanylate cyclase, partial [Planctomycetota bacterium]